MIFEEHNEERVLMDINLSDQEYIGEMNAARDMIARVLWHDHTRDNVYVNLYLSCI